MTVDHFQPLNSGGNDNLDNLVYCCHACNEFKGDYWQPEPNLVLIHPGVDDTTIHFHEQDDGTLVATSERGANHLQILRLNRPTLVAFRLEQKSIMLSRQLNETLLRHLQDSQHTTRLLETELERETNGG